MTFASARTATLKIAATLIAAAALSTSAVHAQVPTSRLAVVTVPFAFESGSAHLPAGTYTISLSGAQLMSVSSAGKDGSMSLVRHAADTQNSANTRVVFHRYGNQYFLREVWDEGATNHVVTVETRAEAKVRKASTTITVAGIAPAVEQVTIAAR